MTKIAGSGAGSESIIQRHGSSDRDPYQNVTDPLVWRKIRANSATSKTCLITVLATVCHVRIVDPDPPDQKCPA
jgi:hypothetical protein